MAKELLAFQAGYGSAGFGASMLEPNPSTPQKYELQQACSCKLPHPQL
jgi:hypothetical protein